MPGLPGIRLWVRSERQRVAAESVLLLAKPAGDGNAAGQRREERGSGGCGQTVEQRVGVLVSEFERVLADDLPGLGVALAR